MNSDVTRQTGHGRPSFPAALKGVPLLWRLIFKISRLRLPRIWSNVLLRELGPLFGGEVINVSGALDRDKQGRRYKTYFPNASAYYVSNYQGEMGLDDAADISDFAIDLTRPIPADLLGRFDVVFNHTTLEHIYDARVAFQYLCQMSKDIVIVVVPFAQHLHYSNSWGDYWRFTPMSLRRFFAENGFEVIFEAYSPFENAPIYLFVVGSRRAERWRKVFMESPPIEAMGDWIGRPIFPALVGAAKWLGRRLRDSS